MINVKFCIMVVLIEFYPFIPFKGEPLSSGFSTDGSLISMSTFAGTLNEKKKSLFITLDYSSRDTMSVCDLMLNEKSCFIMR